MDNIQLSVRATIILALLSVIAMVVGFIGMTGGGVSILTTGGF